MYNIESYHWKIVGLNSKNYWTLNFNEYSFDSSHSNKNSFISAFKIDFKWYDETADIFKTNISLQQPRKEKYMLKIVLKSKNNYY